MNNSETEPLVNKDKIKVIASKDNWIEGEALKQLEKTAQLPGILKAIGLPDIHPGRGTPVGAAFVSKKIIYPHLIGNDVGCGIGLWKTNLKKRKFKRDKWIKKLSELEKPWAGDRTEWLSAHGLESSDSDHALGTIGSGNHFAELQAIEKIYDQNICDELQLDKKLLMMVIHSGSRDIGDALFRSFAEEHRAQGLQSDTNEAKDYLERHDYALKWAAASRALIAHRMSEKLGGECESVLDIFHNAISKIESHEELWLHRKGAAPSDCGCVVIPGTRGSLSYLVSPIGDQRQNAWSLPHGAGRKWNRSTTKARLKSRYNADSFLKTDLGGYVICEDKKLLFEEAPQAYKNIDTVINDMLEAGIITIVATLRPLITYKVRKSS
ncbi:RNA ligase RtcB family protein [Desulfonema magnum]|uniref:3'-phosphate/5'-hydroxy nucleic acid ligase n=1 Tax=Desulfonema magnum TaxID=45655 RepID=A0A975BI82_9BACT|nr:RNA ligase RtcB family protein [Desulfonema magnum]QTA85790.1 Release factor family protein, RctB-like [Desulfonema magnum]